MTETQRRILSGLARDRAKAHLLYDMLTDSAWQMWGVPEIDARVRMPTFRALVRCGWIVERSDWAEGGQTFFVISDAGMAALEAAR